MFASWQTTVAGIAAAVAAWANAIHAQFDMVADTIPDWGVAVSITLIAIGLMKARDNGVTSEQAGAK